MLTNNHPVKVFTTTGSEVIARDIGAALQTRLPTELRSGDEMPLGRTAVEHFSNGNLQVQVDNVRGHFVVVIHTQTPPVSDNLIELFALLDAINNARPADVLLVFPYMPYARSDRKNQPRISTMGHRLPHILTQSFGIRRVLLLDPHDAHVKHYFEPAADEISAIYLLADYVEHQFFPAHPRENCVVVFADAGAAKRFGKLAYLTKLPIAYIDKDRPDNSELTDIKKTVGEVRGKDCLLVDDEILTGGTVLGDLAGLLLETAQSISMLAIHPILDDKKTGAAAVVQKLENSALEKIVVTDSVPVRHKLNSTSAKFTVLPVAPLLAEAVSRIVRNQSLTELHQYDQVFRYRF